eukprot:SAG31_NODE_279_length_18600_cov_21.254527_21_plen_174_part_00
MEDVDVESLPQRRCASKRPGACTAACPGPWERRHHRLRRRAVRAAGRTPSGGAHMLGGRISRSGRRLQASGARPAVSAASRLFDRPPGGLPWHGTPSQHHRGCPIRMPVPPRARIHKVTPSPARAAQRIPISHSSAAMPIDRAAAAARIRVRSRASGRCRMDRIGIEFLRPYY